MSKAQPPQNTKRSRDGRWQPGQSGNPGGRPSTPKEVLDFIGAHTLEAAERLVSIMRSNDPQQARLAAEALLDRRLGKAQTSVTLAVERGPGAVGGSPDQARQRLEDLIAAAEKDRQPLPADTGTDPVTVALPPIPSSQTNGDGGLGEAALDDVANSRGQTEPNGGAK